MKNTSPFGSERKLTRLLNYGRSVTPRYHTPKMTQPGFFTLPLLVTGNGRSGTTWLAKTFQKAGIDCPHEHCGAQGTVSWYFFGDCEWSPYHVSHRPVGRVIHIGERRSDFKFQNIVHLVRHPLKVIGSMTKVMSLTDHLYAINAGAKGYDLQILTDRKISRLRKTMHMAYGIWHQAELACSERIRIEDVKSCWDHLTELAEADCRPMPVIPPTNKSSGYYKALPLKWSDLKAEDKLLAKKIQKLSETFGYGR